MNWLLLKNSLLVSGLTALVSVSLGFLAALWLAGLGKGWRMRALAVALLPLALPPFLVTNCWLDLLGNTGVLRHWLPLNIFSLGGAVLILSLMLWPIPMLAAWSAWRRLEQAQLESDSAMSGGMLIRALLFPLARTSLGQATVLTFVLALNNFAVPAILQVKVFPAELWVRFNTTFDSLGALRLSWPMLLAPLLLVAWFSRREFPWPHLSGTLAPELFRRQLGRGWVWCCGAFAVVLCVLSVGLPLAQLVSTRRTWTELPGALAAGWSACWNSFFYASMPATFILTLALARALSFSSLGRSRSNCRSRREEALVGKSKIQNPKSKIDQSLLTSTPTMLRGALGVMIDALAWLAFLVPGVLLGVGLVQVFNHPWSAAFYASAGIVILAFVIRYFALGRYSLRHAFQTLDADLADDARLNGATPVQMFRYVQWPQIAPQMAAAWYIIFLLCLWDVESMILVVPPGGETLALRIFNLLHYGHNAQVNALCLALLGLALAPLLIWSALRCLRPILAPYVSHVTHHASRVTLITLAALPFAGCTPPSASDETPLSSRIFSRVQIIGSRGVGLGELNKTRSVAVDNQDNLYVVDMTGRLQKFSPDGAFLRSWQMPQTDLGKPKGMGWDRAGNIIVVEPHYQRVNHFSPEGNLSAQWGQKGTNAGQFMLPRAVAVNSRGDIYVSEYGAMERVQRFRRASGTASVGNPAPTFTFLSSFGHSGTGPGEFNRPEGLCIDSQDRVYVADSCNHRIQIFTGDGQFIRAYGKAGTGKGELSYPYDICVDAAGRQYVCEFGNSRIQVFDATDQPIEILGGPGTAPGRFNNPWGVALDSAGNLYVADSQNHRVQKLIRRQSITKEVNSNVAWAEAPKSNIQAPKKLQILNSKLDRIAAIKQILELDASLELGCWSLDFPFLARP